MDVVNISGTNKRNKMIVEKTHLYPVLAEYLKNINLNSVTNERKEILQPLVEYIQNKVDNQKQIRINFIFSF